MPFFTKKEIMDRMKELRANYGPEAVRANLNLAVMIEGSAMFHDKLRSGEDYSEHSLTVGNQTYSVTKKIIGILHDVVEKGHKEDGGVGWTLEDLREIGFSERIVAGIDAMTHRPRRDSAGNVIKNEKGKAVLEEPYYDFIERCSLNHDAYDRKIRDLRHNMDTSRTGTFLDKGDIDRTNKYVVAHDYLVAIKKEDIEPGSSIVEFVCNNPRLLEPKTVLRLLESHSSRGPEISVLREAFGGAATKNTKNAKDGPKRTRTKKLKYA